MSGLPVIFEFTNKYDIPFHPERNRYSDHCRESHFPEQIQVLPKKNLLQAVNLALKKGAHVNQNAAISKLCVTKKTSDLNVDNLCCISHRWTTTDMKVDDFISEFKQFLRSGMFVGTDVCFDDRNYQDSFIAWHEIVRGILRSRFDSEEQTAKSLLKFLVKNVTPRGLLSQPKDICDDEDASIDLSIISTQEMMWKALQRESDYGHLITDARYNETIESLVKIFLYISRPEFLPHISKSARDKTVNSFKGKIVGKSDYELLQSIQSVLKQASDSLMDASGKKLKDLDEAVMKGLEHFSKIPGRSDTFNGYDPTALAVLLMTRDSAFEYFWVDAFCAPQGHASMEDTLKAVKDGMAVFSLSTVLVVPPFDMNNWIAMKKHLLKDVIKRKDSLADFYKKLPALTMTEKGLLFCDSSYFERLWTLHEMAIGGRPILWTQFLFGPFSKVEKDKKVFSVDCFLIERFKVTLTNDEYASGMIRTHIVNLLRSEGIGQNSLRTMFKTNYDCMQTTYSRDWDTLATSIFALKPDQPLSDQLLYRKFGSFESFLVQYSPPGKKYSYAWAVRPEDINHTFRFDKDKNLIAGCVENPAAKTKPAKFSLNDGSATLDGKLLLSNCSAYTVREISQAGLFEPLGLQALYANIGIRKKEFENGKTPGYLIFGSWKLPEHIRKKGEQQLKEAKEAKPETIHIMVSEHALVDYLTNQQCICILKSSDPGKDFTLVYSLTPMMAISLPYQIMGDTLNISGATKIDSLDINMI